MGKRKKGIWTMAAVLLLFLCGCGNGTEGGQDGPPGEQRDYVYAAEHQSLDVYCESITAVALGGGQNVWIAGAEDGKHVLLSLKIGEDEVEEYPLELEEGTQVSAIGKDTEGNLLLGTIRYRGDSLAERVLDRVAIQKVTPEGKTLETIDTGNIFLKKSADSFYISNILQDKEGNYYISATQELCVLHPDGSVYFEIPLESYILELFAMRDGRIAAGYNGNRGWEMGEVDLARGELTPLESGMAFNRGTYRGGTDSDLLYTQDAVLYTCNLTDKEPTALLNWTDNDINSNNLKDFMILPDGRIVALTIDFSAGASKEISILTEKKRSEMQEKTVLTYASLDFPFYAQKDIVAFNKQSERYEIEIKEYGDDTMEYGDRIAMLNADLTGNQPPDIIDISQMSLEDLIAAGVAEDLAPWLEKDPAMGREDFVENVMKAYERDGKLYAIMPSFGIAALIGKVSDVGDGGSWSIEEMAALMDAKEKDAEMLEYADKATVLWLLCRVNQEWFVDRESGTCRFTGGEFEKMLEFADRFPEEPAQDPNAPSEIEKLRSGRLLLVNGMITSVELYQVYEYEFGEPVNFIGYPVFGEESGTMLVPQGTTVAMHAASPNKDGVWEFIRFILSGERQESLNAINGSGFPVLQQVLDKQLKAEMEDEYYEDADGSMKLRPKNSWAAGDLDIQVYAATQEQVDRIRELAGTARADSRMDEKLFQIIYEEAAAYFSGQKSAQEVAELVQNRVQTYLNETK